MKPSAPLLLAALIVLGSGCGPAANAQRSDLYRCEGCDAIHEHAFDDLTSSTVIPADDEPGESLVLTGTVYEVDGSTPAAGVVIYAYHTNAEGIYPTRGDESGWARRHGYLRGWVMTGDDGRYRFETIRPGSYPGREAPQHIHLTVKEPGTQEYWIDEVLFDDDPFVTEEVKRSQRGRGGSGIVHPERGADGTWTAVRDIILERHPK